jgi:hypothetical protein
MGALGFATTLLGSLPSLIAGGVQVLDLIKSGNAKLSAFASEKRDPTDAEWAELNASIDAKRAELHK